MTISTRQLLPRGERQAQVLRAAARAFARSGYVSTSMEDTSVDVRAGAATAADELVGVDLGDAPDRPWVDRMIASYVVESVLAWLDQGDPARDAEFVAEANAGLKALYETWVGPLG